MNRSREPAIVVHGSVAEHLEVLSDVPILRCRVVERIEHAHAIHGALRGRVDHLGLWKARGLENGGSHVDDMVKLRA